MRNGSATAGNVVGAMSSAAPWLVNAPEPMTTEPTRTWSWIEPDVPTRMIVRTPAWTSSLTTMLIDGAPIPLVAHTTGAPPGNVATKASSPRLRASGRPPPRCSVAISSERAGSPLSSTVVVPSGRSAAPNPMWYSRPSIAPTVGERRPLNTLTRDE